MKKLICTAIFVIAGCNVEANAEQHPKVPLHSEQARYSATDLRSAIAAAFPSRKPVRDAYGGEWTFEDHRLVTTAFGPVLVSEGRADIDTIGRATGGRIDVVYLSRAGSDFWVERRFSPALEIGSGGAVGEWAIVESFSENPAVYASGGFTGQGITEGCAVIVELAPTGPREIAVVPDYFGEPGGKDVQGKIENIVKSSRFDVRYSGNLESKPINAVRRFLWEGDRYKRQGPAVLTHCGEAE